MPEEQNNAKRTDAQSRIDMQILVETLIFASDEPLPSKTIRELLATDENDQPVPDVPDAGEIKKMISALNANFEETGRAYRIIEIAGGYQFATLPDYAFFVGKLYEERAKRKLSQSSIETLAIVAYKQPISKPEIERIRGVNCDYVLKTLLEKDLATIVGRAETVGRPLLYGTTKQFLIHMGLNVITDLPRPREIEEILGESTFETERRMIESQDAAEKTKKQQEEDFKSRLPHIPKRKPELDEAQVEIFEKKKTREIKTLTKEQIEAENAKKAPQLEKSAAKLQVPPPREPEENGAQIPTIESPIESVESSAQVSSEQTEKPIVFNKDLDGSASIEEGIDTLPAAVPIETPSKTVEEPAVEMNHVSPAHSLDEKSVSEQTTELRTPADAETLTISTQHPASGVKSNQHVLDHDETIKKSRWEQWKETIVGFVKRLFA
jgi:segregation and condensation protein B